MGSDLECEGAGDGLFRFLFRQMFYYNYVRAASEKQYICSRDLGYP